MPPAPVPPAPHALPAITALFTSPFPGGQVNGGPGSAQARLVSIDSLIRHFISSLLAREASPLPQKTEFCVSVSAPQLMESHSSSLPFCTQGYPVNQLLKDTITAPKTLGDRHCDHFTGDE